MTTEDEVDLLIADWTLALPAVDLSPLDVMSRMRRLVASIDVLRTEALAAAGVEPWAFDILSRLRVAPGHALTPSALGRMTGAPSATVANRLDRLERAGHVTRRLNRADTRSRLAELTPQGTDAADRAMTELVQAESRVLVDLSETQTNTLIELLRAMGPAIAGVLHADDGDPGPRQQ